MQRTADGEDPCHSGDRNNGHHVIASDLVSLIEHVRTSMKLLEAAIASESAPGDQEGAGNVFVLDDVMPRYIKANAALSACNAGLGVALHYLLDARAARQGACESPGNRHPISLVNRR